MERQKQNYRIGFPIASIYSAKLRPNRLGPNIQNQQKIKGPIQQHCIPSGPPSFLFVAGPIQGIQQIYISRLILLNKLNELSIKMT